jgi:glycine/D-amino acid oxidase-like deaminating enzyme
MVRLGAFAPDLVFNLILQHDIACQAIRSGTIRAAISARGEKNVVDYHRQWLANGAAVDLLDTSGMAAATGTTAYSLGCLDQRGGNLNPLAFVRGLADAASKAGARIFVGARATALKKSGDSWTINTPEGTVRAARVILATNGYTDNLWPGLRRSIIPVHSSIAATAPLPAQIAAEIMPGRPSLYEMSAGYIYYRLDADGRFLIGGRGVLRDTSNPADFAKLIAYATKLFPTLDRAQWTHCWNGQTAVTWDHLPHIHEPEAGISIGLGYNGRGIAVATAVGKMLAARANSASEEAFDLPVTRISPLTGHVFWPLAVRARLTWESLRERTGF